VHRLAGRRALRGGAGRRDECGDRYERDIAGAIEAGLFTIWMNLRNEPLPENAPAPDAIVTTIAEVSALLL